MNHLTFAKKLAKRAGKIIRSDFEKEIKKEWKADNTPVTETDKKINTLVLNEIRKTYPDHDILAEEESHAPNNSEYVWVCDPLDGTIPFSHGLAASVFSIALTKNGQSILGVIYDPFLKRLFSAEKGAGAFLNKKRIKVSGEQTLQNSVVGITSWKEKGYSAGALLNILNKKGAKSLNTGSIIQMGALVAAGEFAAIIFAGQTAHDSAAIKIIVEEAGGKVTDLWGADQRYDQKINGLLATNGKLHNELLACIKDALK